MTITSTRLDYLITNTGNECSIQISADFPIFKNNQKKVIATIDDTGTILYIGFDSFG